MIRFREISNGMWKTCKMIEPHICQTDNYKEDHFNMNSNMIVVWLIPYIMQNPDVNIKLVRETIKGKHHFTSSYRKAQQGWKKAFEMVYDDFEGSFKALPRYMVARESFDSWSRFLKLLWRHVVCERQGIGLISDRHQGILQCIQSYDWLSPPYTYNRFCVRQLKANFSKK